MRAIAGALATAPSASSCFPPTPVTAQSETALALNSAYPALPETSSSDASGTTVAAAAGTLDEVVDIMASVLGISVRDLSVNDDLERLGMDSLMSIEAQHAISTALHVDLPDNVFSSCKTILDLQRTIQASRPDLSTSFPSSPPPPPSAASSHSSTSTKLASFGTDINPVQFQIANNEDGKTSPVFLIHDGSGIAHCYGRIAPLGRAVWGVHNPKFSTGESWSGGLLEMAAHYAGLIRCELEPGQGCVVGGMSTFFIVSLCVILMCCVCRLVCWGRYRV